MPLTSTVAPGKPSPDSSRIVPLMVCANDISANEMSVKLSSTFFISKKWFIGLEARVIFSVKAHFSNALFFDQVFNNLLTSKTANLPQDYFIPDIRD